MELNNDILGELIDLLAPLMEGEQDRRALLKQALTGIPVLKKIDYSGSTHTFVTNTVTQLANYGKVVSGKQALWVLLETARDHVGIEKKGRIDALHNAVNVPQRVTGIQPTVGFEDSVPDGVRGSAPLQVVRAPEVAAELLEHTFYATLEETPCSIKKVQEIMPQIITAIRQNDSRVIDAVPRLLASHREDLEKKIHSLDSCAETDTSFKEIFGTLDNIESTLEQINSIAGNWAASRFDESVVERFQGQQEVALEKLDEARTQFQENGTTYVCTGDFLSAQYLFQLDPLISAVRRFNKTLDNLRYSTS